MNEILTLDVREDLRQGREPFSKIMSAAGQLRVGQQLMLVAPFEPVPLFAVLRKQGFEHQARQLSSGDWEALFTRAEVAAGILPAVEPGFQPGGTSFPSTDGTATSKTLPISGTGPGGTMPPSTAGRMSAAVEIIDVDARGLEPPQPMIKILETLATLPDGAVLRAHTERKPMHLYAQLEERGFVGETEEQADGSHVTHIRRR